MENKIIASEKKAETFPAGFLWGAATSSYQTEGNNSNSDWWEWEQKGKTKDKSGVACDYWNRWREDHELLSELGVNSFRLSLEWSRIEPEEGKFSEEAINHYREILQDLKNRNIKTVVTFWHYTVPLWFAHKYGWQNKKAVDIFSRYCQEVIDNFGENIDMVVTINEPRLPLNRGYLLGTRPPGKINPLAFLRARKNMVKAHKECYRIIKKKYPEILVGIAQFCNDFDFFGRSKFLNFITEKIEDFYNWYFFKEIGEDQDFIGINYYFGMAISLKPPFLKMQKERTELTDIGWGIFSEGLYEIIKDVWKTYKKPIYILENGIANKTDRLREDFIVKHLRYIQKAIQEGVDVRGYFYWSFMDNFEWEDGFDYRFGLVEIDYKTLERKPRSSFYAYKKIIENNGIKRE
jgi:beta-glucosidase